MKRFLKTSKSLKGRSFNTHFRGSYFVTFNHNINVQPSQIKSHHRHPSVVNFGSGSVPVVSNRRLRSGPAGVPGTGAVF